MLGTKATTLLIVYLKVKFNWATCDLSGDPRCDGCLLESLVYFIPLNELTAFKTHVATDL